MRGMMMMVVVVSRGGPPLYPVACGASELAPKCPNNYTPPTYSYQPTRYRPDFVRRIKLEHLIIRQGKIAVTYVDGRVENEKNNKIEASLFIDDRYQYHRVLFSVNEFI